MKLNIIIAFNSTMRDHVTEICIRRCQYTSEFVRLAYNDTSLVMADETGQGSDKLTILAMCGLH